jgi:hypothetical protein
MSLLDAVQSNPFLYLDQWTLRLTMSEAGELVASHLARDLKLAKTPGALAFTISSRQLFPGLTPEMTITFRGTPAATDYVYFEPDDLPAPLSATVKRGMRTYRGVVTKLYGLLAFHLLNNPYPLHDPGWCADDEFYGVTLALAGNVNAVAFEGNFGPGAGCYLTSWLTSASLWSGNRLSVKVEDQTWPGLVDQPLAFTAAAEGLLGPSAPLLSFAWDARHFNPDRASAGPAASLTNAQTFRCPPDPSPDETVACTVAMESCVDRNGAPTVCKARGERHVVVVNSRQHGAVLNARRIAAALGSPRPIGPQPPHAWSALEVFKQLEQNALELARNCREVLESWPARREAPAKKPGSKAKAAE